MIQLYIVGVASTDTQKFYELHVQSLWHSCIWCVYIQVWQFCQKKHLCNFSSRFIQKITCINYTCTCNTLHVDCIERNIIKGYYMYTYMYLQSIYYEPTIVSSFETKFPSGTVSKYDILLTWSSSAPWNYKVFKCLDTTCIMNMLYMYIPLPIWQDLRKIPL